MLYASKLHSFVVPTLYLFCYSLLGSTLSFTEQVIQSLAPSLVKAHKLGAHRVSVSYSLSQRSPSLPNEYLSVPLVEGSFSVLTEGDLQSAQVTLLSTHFCKVLEQYL